MLASEAILVMVRFRCWYQKLLVVWIISKSEGFTNGRLSLRPLVPRTNPAGLGV